jgi:hypothetical protein
MATDTPPQPAPQPAQQVTAKLPPFYPYPEYDPEIASVTWTRRGHRRFKLNEQQRRFIAAYLGPAAEFPARAAQMAGYARPAEHGATLERNLREAIELEREARRRVFVMGPEETLARLTYVARLTPDSTGVGAAKTIAQIHGMLATNLTLSLDRGQLVGEIRTALREVMANAEIIDAQLVQTKALPEPT